jgi:hypothetical protein
MDFYQSKFGFKTKEKFHIQSIQNLVNLNKSQAELPRSNSLQKTEVKEIERSPYKSIPENNKRITKQFNIVKNITVMKVSIYAHAKINFYLEQQVTEKERFEHEHIYPLRIAAPYGSSVANPA